MMTKQTAITQLQAQIDKIKEVQATRRFGATFTKWRRDTAVVISQIFSGDDKHISDFTGITYANPEFPSVTDAAEEARHQRVYEEGLEHAKAIINSCIDEIKQYWKENEPTSISPHELCPPEEVTIPWLLKHVPVRLWLAALSLLLAAFLAGVGSTRISIVGEIFQFNKLPAIQSTTPK